MIGLPLGLYLCLVLAGTIPVNNAFEPTADGIEIFLVSSSVHADIVVPIETDVVDWRASFPARHFAGDTRMATRAVIGWGDRDFFTAAPTWADLRLTTVVKALFWPSEACMHVYLLTAASRPIGARSVKISLAQYERLVAYIDASFRHDADGSLIPIQEVAYGSNDAFFEAQGWYSIFNTCNSWVGKALQVTGVRTGWFTPLPKTVFLHLPK
ncbi:MAG: TIGR02117 family protein [Cyanobacteria bacterium J06641_5]